MGRRIFLVLLLLFGLALRAVMSLSSLCPRDGLLPSPRIIARLPLLPQGCIFHAFIPATCSLLLKCRHLFPRHRLGAFAMRIVRATKTNGQGRHWTKPDASKNCPKIPCNLKPQNENNRFELPSSSSPWHETGASPFVKIPFCGPRDVNRQGSAPLLPLHAKTPRHKLAMLVPPTLENLHIATFSSVLLVSMGRRVPRRELIRVQLCNSMGMGRRDGRKKGDDGCSARSGE